MHGGRLSGIGSLSILWVLGSNSGHRLRGGHLYTQCHLPIPIIFYVMENYGNKYHMAYVIIFFYFPSSPLFLEEFVGFSDLKNIKNSVDIN